ncbi:MAG: phage protein Gp36 family protein [Planctomycetota bacterium]|jgi:phage gp36-like protein
MSYAISDDVIRRMGSAALIHLADEDGDGIPDQAVLDHVLSAAQGEVDSILANRYRVPVSLAQHPELSDLLQAVVLDVVEYRLRLRRPPIPEDTLRQYQSAVTWLTKIAVAAADLPALSPLERRPDRSLDAATTGDRRTLTREELTGL